MEPLASKYRPSDLNEFIGQQLLVGEGMPIRMYIETGNIPSMIFWGPPGTGKTTLANIISKKVNANFYKMSAVMSGKSDLTEIIKKAMLSNKTNTDIQQFNFEYKKNILFLDEIHRWNKAQQDALLPYIEKGIITLIGATTENPSFSLIPALLSRTRVFTFNKHNLEEVKKFLKSIINRAKDKGEEIEVDEESLNLISEAADGDLRTASNILEGALLANNNIINKRILKNTIENFLQYESKGEDHYNIISAVHKSMRDSDPDASVYWITRMLEAGDDPLYVARRLLRFASEDIGNADPQALILAHSIFESCQKLGRPECDIFLIQLAIYLAKAPKDNSAYIASNLAKEDVHKFGSQPVPFHLRNAPTKLMKEWGYGNGYKYAHDFDNAKVEQEHFPEKLKNRKYLKDNKSKYQEII